MKVCSKCKTPKPRTDFYGDRRKPDGLRSQCKDCHNDGARTWQAANRERDLSNKRAYKARQYEERGEDLRSEWREWYHTTPELQKTRRQKWAKANPEKIRTFTQQRRARKKNAPQGCGQEAAAYRAILAHDPCSYCGGSAEVADHIQPLLHGGAESWENLTAACNSCNSSKGAKFLLHFLAGRA